MNKLRMRFSKTGRAIYISHLDLMHTMQRAFQRAEYKIKHSEGYNPHPIISIALPLSVGMSSVCEIMDFRLEDETDPSAIAATLNAQLPEGITIMEVYEPERKAAELKWLEIQGRLEYDSADKEEMAAKLREFYSQDSIVITKKSKRGFTDFDLVTGIKRVAFEAKEDCVELRAVVSAQEPTFNPELFAEALRQKNADIAPDFAKFARVETYDEKMKVFR